MAAVTGREIVYDMMQLGLSIARWNKQYSTKETVAKRVDELGLTFHQVEVLGFMKNNPELQTVSEIAAELCISKGSLSLMLSKLQLGGFVQKTSAKGSDDGRKVYIALTEKGEAALEEILELMLENATQLFAELDEEKREQIYEKIQELKDLFNTGGWKE